MRIISWNTNGLRATIKQGNFDNLFKKYKPDIVCLQETKCNPDQLDKEIVNYKDYTAYFAYPTLKKGYSGVAIYTKIKPTKVEYGIGISGLDDEGRAIVCYFPSNTGGIKSKWILINCYFPNGGGGPERLKYKLEFYDAFLKFINKKRKAGYEVIFTGDINTAHNEIDLARPKENEKNTGFLPEERDWLDEVVRNGYLDVFRNLYPNKKDVYTYWDQKTRARDRNVGWRIDYFFISSPIMQKIQSFKTFADYMGSDHCPIMIEVA
jgi:exodeoxyribonuclease-3